MMNVVGRRPYTTKFLDHDDDHGYVDENGP